MSLYADYIKERLNDDIIETNDGFLTYRYIDWKGQKAVYIIDLYVIPSKRQSGLATQLANTVVEEAKAKGCTIAIGSVSTLIKTKDQSIKVLIAYGMTEAIQGPDYIYFSKPI